jgi:hypothetical protein
MQNYAEWSCIKYLELGGAEENTAGEQEVGEQEQKIEQ